MRNFDLSLSFRSDGRLTLRVNFEFYPIVSFTGCFRNCVPSCSMVRYVRTVIDAITLRLGAGKIVDSYRIGGFVTLVRARRLLAY